jgi:general secretion pathway protein K
MTGRSTLSRRFEGPPARQRGIAMLVAILLVALATIIAVAVAYENAMTARRGTATISFDDALLINQGAEAFAAYGLRAVKTNDKSGDTYLAQPWAQPLGPLEVVPGVTLEASLEDMEGRFNLNWLVASDGSNKADPIATAAFTHLLELLGIEPKWTDMIVDWIDSDSIALPDGGEDSTYLGQNPPYLTANQYITSTSELLALPGFGHDRYAKLAPYITALPPMANKLNICTASGYVLDAFNPGRQEWSTDPNSLAQNRTNAGACFPTMQGYQASFEGTTWGQVTQHLETKSHFFRLSSLVTIGTAEFNLYSLLYVDDNGFYVHPIQRTFSPD